MRTAEVPAAPLPLDAAPPPAGAAAPGLAGVVLRRALPVAAGFMVLLLVISGVAVQRDTRAEMEGALDTARLSRYLSNLPQLSDNQALAVLRDRAQLRHLQLRVVDGDNRTLLGSEQAPTAAERAVSWTVPRPVGAAWTVTLTASPRTEWREALRRHLEVLAVFVLGTAALLGVVHLTLRRALAPLRALPQALAALAAPAAADAPEAAAGLAAIARRLHPAHGAELQRTASALHGLADALSGREQQLRGQARRALSAQEAERQCMADEMHEDFAQRLTALRLDTTWLRRRLEGNPQFEPVIAGMLGQLGTLQNGLRGWVHQLHPLLPRRAAGSTGLPEQGMHAPTPQCLRGLLAETVQACAAASDGRLDVRLHFDADIAQLPAPLLLAVLRMTQEALANVALHAAARQARVTVQIDGRAGILAWQVSDDGVGLRDPAQAPRRGHGLAALQQHAWAHGAALALGPGPGGRGLQLSARLRLDAA